MHLAELFASLALTGLIWTIQLVHYPLFGRVGAENFMAYHAEHGRRITPLVAPLMLLELIASGARLFGPTPRLEALGGFGLTVLVWASTALIQVPLHEALGRGAGDAAVRRLVRTNWIRTAAWTARAVLVLHWTAAG